MAEEAKHETVDKDEKSMKPDKASDELANTSPAPTQRPTAKSWLVAGIACGILLAGLIGFIAGGLVTAHRVARADERRGNSTGFITMQSGFPAQSYGRRTAETSASITAVSDSSITVKYTNGASTTFAIGGDTRIVKADGSEGTVGDLKTGQSVKIRGVGIASTRTASMIEIS